MLFSVLIPLYNSEKYISETIESVLKQTEKDFEIIIVNDGSTDNSELIAKRYAGESNQVKVINQSNKGLFHTRYAAVQEAKGEYIIFLDSDDTLKTNTLGILRKELKDGDIDIIIYKLTRVYSSGKIKESRQVFKNNVIFERDSKVALYKKIIEGSSINSMCTKVIRKSCFDINEFQDYPNITMGEDLVHTLRPLTRAKKIKYIDKSLYNYKIHDSSMSKTFDPHFFEKAKIINDILMKFVEEWNINHSIDYRLLYQRFLKSIISLVFSKTNINGYEKEFINEIYKIRSDNQFKGAISDVRSLPLVYRFLLLIIRKGSPSTILVLKSILGRR